MRRNSRIHDTQWDSKGSGGCKEDQGIRFAPFGRRRRLEGGHKEPMRNTRISGGVGCGRLCVGQLALLIVCQAYFVLLPFSALVLLGIVRIFSPFWCDTAMSRVYVRVKRGLECYFVHLLSTDTVSTLKEKLVPIVAYSTSLEHLSKEERSGRDYALPYQDPFSDNFTVAPAQASHLRLYKNHRPVAENQEITDETLIGVPARAPGSGGAEGPASASSAPSGLESGLAGGECFLTFARTRQGIGRLARLRSRLKQIRLLRSRRKGSGVAPVVGGDGSDDEMDVDEDGEDEDEVMGWDDVIVWSTKALRRGAPRGFGPEDVEGQIAEGAEGEEEEEGEQSFGAVPGGGPRAAAASDEPDESSGDEVPMDFS